MGGRLSGRVSADVPVTTAVIGSVLKPGMPWHSPFDMNGTTAVNIAEM